MGLVPVFVLGSLLLSITPAHAICAELPPLEQALDQAQTVFVGTVTDVQYRGRVATFEVEEVWKGDVGAVVVVNGSGASLSELDAAQAQGYELWVEDARRFNSGRRYLVVSHDREGAMLTDSMCSATRIFTSDLEQYRPESAAAPGVPPAPDTGDDGAPTYIWFVLTALAVVATVAWRRLATRQTPPGPP